MSNNDHSDLIEAFILIGGRSSRFGGPKAFARLGRLTLVERALAAIRNGLGDVRVTAVAGDSAQFGANLMQSSPVPFIFDIFFDRGPVGGFHAALAHARAPWIFLLACDLPFVPGGLIEFLAGRLADNSAAVLPVQEDGRLQPLCAFYRVEATLPIAEKFAARGGHGVPMHELAKALDPVLVPFSEYSGFEGSGRAFTNINTLSDLEKAENC